MNKMTHQDYMVLALELAQRGRFTVSPNPMVGCVIVKNDKIIGQGFHRRAGGHHAEIIALEEAKEEARGATVYVTLEPCCHYGRTPPCTKSLIAAGIKCIYIACKDPNACVNNKGIEALRAANIEVHVGLLEEEAQQLNKIFFHYIKHKRPFVIAKWAMSLDGKTITHPEDTRDISCQKAQQSSHVLRQEVDAILIGARTAKRDNPLLTARFNTKNNARQPIRIILSRKGDIPLNLNMFHIDMPSKTIIATTDLVDETWRKKAEEKNITVLVLEKNSQGQVELSALLDALGKKQITSLLIEGGREVHDNFIQEELINEYRVYLAPVIISKLKQKRELTLTHFSQIETDYYFSARYKVKHV